jgi:hypothetical protein
MTSFYKNPYRAVDPDIEEGFFQREPILRKLDGYLLNVVEPSCASIVAERGTGGRAAVRQFLNTRADKLPFLIVECDVKSDLGKGGTAIDFYRALIRFLLNHLSNLPSAGHRIGNRLIHSTFESLYDLESDLWEFFQAIRGSENTPPLLLVFYSFDRLPYHFSFDGLDWSYLKELHNQVNLRVYYLVVSRRPLRYIESLHGLEKSLFSTIFLPPYRVGLLSDKETWTLIREPAESILKCPPWSEWLAEHIFEWGGRHPYCTQYICFELFERIWNQREHFEPSDADRLATELGSGLREYFTRLYDNLANDELLDPLVQTVVTGFRGSQSPQIEELVDLGYFLPEPALERQYTLFSPLFYRYLVQRGDLSPPPPPPVVEPKPALPKVQAILDLENPSPNVQLWFEDYRRQHKRIAEKPDVDGYVLLFLTGLEEGLNDQELLELRRHLLQRYCDDCQERGDRRKFPAIRTYFYSECGRWRQRFEED